MYVKYDAIGEVLESSLQSRLIVIIGPTDTLDVPFTGPVKFIPRLLTDDIKFALNKLVTLELERAAAASEFIIF